MRFTDCPTCISDLLASCPTVSPKSDPHLVFYCRHAQTTVTARPPPRALLSSRPNDSHSPTPISCPTVVTPKRQSQPGHPPRALLQARPNDSHSPTPTSYPTVGTPKRQSQPDNHLVPYCRHVQTTVTARPPSNSADPISSYPRPFMTNCLLMTIIEWRDVFAIKRTVGRRCHGFILRRRVNKELFLLVSASIRARYIRLGQGTC